MPKVSDAHRAARKEQILDAALACFVEKGFQRTSMADIVAASGLSAGALYVHFASKQEIVIDTVRTVVGHRAAELHAMRDAGPDLPDPIAMIRRLTSGMVDDLIDIRLLTQFWGEATTDPELRGLVENVLDGLREAFLGYLTAWAEHRGAVDPAGWARRVLPVKLALTQGFVMQAALISDFDADAYFDGVEAVAGEGFRIPR